MPRHPLSVVAVAAAVLLVSCSRDGSDSSSTTTVATASTSTIEPTSTSVMSPTSSGATTSTSTAGSSGCTTGSAEIPVGAAQRETVDVDGDGLADTAWIAAGDGQTIVGISTAAGGGSQIPYESASPIPRSLLVANVDEQGPVEIIVSDGRGASLFAFSDCAVQPVENDQGETYQFDLQNLRGFGTGVGCISTDDGRRLVGLQTDERSATEVAWTSTVIDLDGLRATNGSMRSGTYELPAEQAKADLLTEISCGDLTMADDGIFEPQ